MTPRIKDVLKKLPPLIKSVHGRVFVDYDVEDENGVPTGERTRYREKIGRQVPLRAKFKGRCVTCDGVIWPGDPIFYDTFARRALHARPMTDCVVNYLPDDDDVFLVNDEIPESVVGEYDGPMPWHRRSRESVDPLDNAGLRDAYLDQDWAGDYTDCFDHRTVEGPTLDDRNRFFLGLSNSMFGGWGPESHVEDLDSPTFESISPTERAANTTAFEQALAAFYEDSEKED